MCPTFTGNWSVQCAGAYLNCLELEKFCVDQSVASDIIVLPFDNDDDHLYTFTPLTVIICIALSNAMFGKTFFECFCKYLTWPDWSDDLDLSCEGLMVEMCRWRSTQPSHQERHRQLLSSGLAEITWGGDLDLDNANCEQQQNVPS